jgi:hypothetical protein
LIQSDNTAFNMEMVKGTGLEIREYGRKDPSRWPCGTPYPQKLALTSSTSDGRSVGIVRSRTQAPEFSLVLWWKVNLFLWLTN